MRLVRFPDDDPGPPSPAAVPALEICVRDPNSGVVLAQIMLRLSQVPATMGHMRSVGTSGAAQDVPLAQEPIAGRIDAADSELDVAVEAWLSYLRSRGKKRRSIDAFRQVVQRAVKQCGWTTTGDITFAAVTSWLGAQAWKGATYNRNLSVFRSLTRHMTKAKAIPEDPLVMAERAEDDGGEGARAASIDEARAMILRAWVRDQADRRCKGNRALYWLCLFSHAARLDEPRQWRRKHLVLDHAFPHVIWTADINKGRKRRDCALSPELAEQLRLHLASLDRERAAAGLAPGGPDDLVFPVVPSKATFIADRDACGIPAEDYRGRRFSSHAARKYFSTTLGAMAAEKMVDFLMRHQGRVEHRYFDPPLAEQAEAVAKLPRLWPEQGHLPPDCRVPPGGNVDNSESDLTSRGQPAEYGPGTSVVRSDHLNSRTRPGSASSPPKCQRRDERVELGRVTELLRAAGQGRSEESGTVQSGRIMQPEIGTFP